MDLEQTQPVRSRGTHVWRCPCGHDVLIELDKKGQCDRCGRSVPPQTTAGPQSLSTTVTSLARMQQVTDNRGPDDLVGRRLGHFEIIEPIGSGGMGRIYRALDTSLQRYVAVKVLRHLSGEKDSDARQRLMREAVAQARVNHPNIVTIYHVGVDGEIPFLAMELVDGYDVAELIRQGQIPYETLCGFAIRIVHALDTARHQGIVHSDIKPRNLLVLTNGEVKLSDFGMARLGEVGSEQHLGGTPNYLAPELLEGQPPTIKSDMYALGVTLYEMTFGKLPVALSGVTPVEWARDLENTQIEFPVRWPDHLPEQWREILVRLLARDPEQRFQSWLELGRRLQRILPGDREAAPRLSRATAWGADVAMIAIVSLVPLPLLPDTLSRLALPSALALFTLEEVWWRQSPGRELVRVRAVNQYGLRPSRRKVLARTVLRLLPLWAISLAIIAMDLIPYAFAVLMTGGILWLVVDAGWMIARGNGESLHDSIVRTRAIVGSAREKRYRDRKPDSRHPLGTDAADAGAPGEYRRFH